MASTVLHQTSHCSFLTDLLRYRLCCHCQLSMIIIITAEIFSSAPSKHWCLDPVPIELLQRLKLPLLAETLTKINNISSNKTRVRLPSNHRSPFDHVTSGRQSRGQMEACYWRARARVLLLPMHSFMEVSFLQTSSCCNLSDLVLVLV